MLLTLYIGTHKHVDVAFRSAFRGGDEEDIPLPPLLETSEIFCTV